MKKYFLVILVLFSCNEAHRPKYKFSKDAREIVANQLYKVEAFISAKLEYDTLISIDSNNPQFYSRRAYCETRLGDYGAAKNDYMRTINMNYDDKATSYLNIGELNRVQGKFDSAVYYYDQCLRIDPHNSNAAEAKKAALLKDSH